MSDLEAQSPPLHAEVRAAIIELIKARQMKVNVEPTADAILQAVADALLAAAKAEKWPEHANMTNTEQSPTPNWIFGYNSGVAAVTRVIGELGGGKDA